MSGNEIWQDKTVEIDLPPEQFELRAGELLAAQFNDVEDTKENSRIRGKLAITNMRVLWRALTCPKINLSLGLDCIVKISYKHNKSKVEGVVEFLQILSQCAADRKEFLFKCVYKTSKSISLVLTVVHNSYLNSKAYRVLKMGQPMPNGFKVLKREFICSSFSGVCNLSDEQGYLGKLLVTNIRVFWFSINNNNHNLSLPFLQVKSVFVQNSKFGLALTFESTLVSRKYRFGFRMNPPEQALEAIKEIKRLLSSSRHMPDFGVDVTEFNAEEEEEENEQETEVEGIVNRRDVYSLLNSSDTEKKEVFYDEELSLMFEKLPDGVDLRALSAVM